jgi:hypothetical protein
VGLVESDRGEVVRVPCSPQRTHRFVFLTAVFVHPHGREGSRHALSPEMLAEQVCVGGAVICCALLIDLCGAVKIVRGVCSLGFIIILVASALTVMPAVMLSPTNNNRRTKAGSFNGNGSKDPSVKKVSMVWAPSAKTSSGLRLNTVMGSLT